MFSRRSVAVALEDEGRSYRVGRQKLRVMNFRVRKERILRSFDQGRLETIAPPSS